jgi:hypothetical protein
MTDEQTIYLSPEQELTAVRELLEKTPAHRITLVIPHRTALHSHVGWRLIAARMRELDKELLVISPDQQVRALARDAGFSVAESSAISGSRGSRPRPSSKVGNINTRGAARERLGNNRAGTSPGRAASSQSPDPRRAKFTSTEKKTPASSVPSSYSPEPVAEEIESEVTFDPAIQQRIEQERLFQQRLKQTNDDELFSARGPAPVTPFSSLPPIGATPSLRPVPPVEDDEEEEDVQSRYDAYYDTAQNIRSAASGGEASRQVAPPPPSPKTGQTSATGHWDPFLDDEQLAPLPEQRGSAPGSLADIHSEIIDLSDRSTSVRFDEIDVEDLGDQGESHLPEPGVGRSSEKKIRPLREQSGYPTSRRPSGPTSRHSPRSPRPGLDLDSENDEDLFRNDQSARDQYVTYSPSRSLPRDNRVPSAPIGSAPGARPKSPTGSTAGARPKSPTGSTAGARPKSPTGSTAGARPKSPTGSTAGAPAAQTFQPVAAPQRAPGSSQWASSRQSGSSGRSRPQMVPQRSHRKRGRGLPIFLLSVVLLVMVVGAIVLFVPTATVTLSIQARAFSHAVQLTVVPAPASAGNVAGQTLTQDFSVTGPGIATGSVTVGNSKAQGSVNLLDTGNVDLTIPSGTIVATSGGITFATQAEAVITAAQANNPAVALPVSIVAVQSGESGNVPANSIKILPSASVQSIASASHVSVSQVQISLTNPDPTTHGGATTEKAVSASDLTKVTASLHKQLQQQVLTWMHQQLQTGDLAGNAVPDVPDSATPLSAEQLSGAPAVNQPEPTGQFTASLHVHIQLLIARAAQIRAAVQTQLNNLAATQTVASTVAPQLPITLSNEKSATSSTQNAFTITATASAETIPLLNINALSSQIAGQGLTQAGHTLQSGPQAVPDLKTIAITVSPGFFPLLPWRAGQIHIILQAIPQAVKQT